MAFFDLRDLFPASGRGFAAPCGSGRDGDAGGVDHWEANGRRHIHFIAPGGRLQMEKRGPRPRLDTPLWGRYNAFVRIKPAPGLSLPRQELAAGRGGLLWQSI